MEEVIVIVALLYLFAISLVRDYLEKRYDRILSLLEDDMNGASEIPPGRSNSICSDSSSCDSDEEDEEEDDDLYLEIIDERRYVL